MSKQKYIAYGAVAVLFGISGAWVGLNQKPPGSPQTTTIAPSPNGPHAAVNALLTQALPDAAGKTQELAKWKGKALLVNFWAPWCGPCVQEMPELLALSKEMPADKLQVIGIGIDSPTNISEFADKFKISYPLYVAGMSGTELSRQFGNVGGGLPFTVLIGADGQVRKTYLGRLKFDELKADLAALKG